MKVFTGVGAGAGAGAGTVSLADVPAAVAKAEAMGFDGLTFGEVSMDAFIPAILAAEHTSRATVGTSITLAFPRSPMVTAYTSWGVQQLSGGRFELGLGAQVRGHNERRFSVRWTPPGPRMREYVQSLRAIFDCWQNGTPLNYQGKEYSFTLMTPEFNPGPLRCGPPRVNLAAVGPYMARLAGEVADGLLPHGLSSARYVHEVTLPSLEEGLRRSGRSMKELRIGGGGMVATGRNQEEVARGFETARRRISFYGSTRAYRLVLDVHGWGDIGDQLREMSFRGRWSEMPRLVTDEMVEAFAVVGTYDSLVSLLMKRYGDYASNVSLGTPEDPDSEAGVRRVIQELHAQPDRP